jgi:hypothetical protein
MLNELGKITTGQRQSNNGYLIEDRFIKMLDPFTAGVRLSTRSW